MVWASCGLGVVCDGLGVVSYLQSDWALCVLGVVWLGCCSDWVLCRMVWVLSYLQSDGLGVVSTGGGEEHTILVTGPEHHLDLQLLRFYPRGEKLAVQRPAEMAVTLQIAHSGF